MMGFLQAAADANLILFTGHVHYNLRRTSLLPWFGYDTESVPKR